VEVRLDPPVLYPIADCGLLGETSLTEAVARLGDAGATWIQLRAKDLEDRALCSEVEACCERAAGTRVRLWINDRVDVAAMFPVAGVHLGQTDLPPSVARRILGRRRWIGRSTHTEEQVREAAADPEVDVIAVGPVFRTASKSDHEPVVGLEFLRRARRMTDKPIVAIGGIDEHRLGEVLRQGADSAAILGAVCRGSIVGNMQRLGRAAGG